LSELLTVNGAAMVTDIPSCMLQQLLHAPMSDRPIPDVLIPIRIPDNKYLIRIPGNKIIIRILGNKYLIRIPDNK